GLHGVASGEVHAMGTPRNLRMEMDLAMEEGGSLRASGGIDLRGANPRYDLQAILGRFDPAAVSTHAPPALLGGTVRAAGSGFAPATAEATLEADLVDDLPRVGGLARVAAPGAEAGAPLAIAPAEDVAPAIDATPDGRAAPGVEAIVLRAGVANGLVSVE